MFNPPPLSAPQLQRAPGTRKDYHVKLFKTPKETLRAIHSAGVAKSTTRVDRLMLLGFLAGAYIALGGAASIAVAGGLPQKISFAQTVVLNDTLVSVPTVAEFKMPGLVRLAMALTFPAGLVLVVIAGAELFTGNVMYLLVPTATGSVKWWRFLLNWVVAYTMNFVGSIFVAGVLAYGSDLFEDEPWKTFCRTIAVTKVFKYNWGALLLRGIGCNWLVCLALYLAIASEDVISKIASVWVCIGTFIMIGK